MTLARAFVEGLADDPEALAEIRRLLGVRAADDPPRLLTPEQAADRLGIHVNTLRKAARAGRVPGAVRAGAKLWRFHPDQLELLAPAGPDDPGSPGPGRGRRRHGPASAAARAILGAS